MTRLRAHLEARRAQHRKLLVPYVTAGIPDVGGFASALDSLAGLSDALEVGLPYSDPLMDGPTIAAASDRVIRSGVGPIAALDLAADVQIDCPLVAMTYYNPVHRAGEAEFCRRAAGAGFVGLIVPDLPLEESESLRTAAAGAELAWVPLVAPTTPPARIEAIVGTATGFVYAVSTLGVTGVRESLSERAARVAAACKQATDLPVLVGIGISTPEQARQAAASADGVVIGSAVVRRLLEEGVDAARAFLESVREALDPP